MSSQNEDNTAPIEIPLSMRPDWPRHGNGDRLQPIHIALNYAVSQGIAPDESAGERILGAVGLLLVKVSKADGLDAGQRAAVELALYHWNGAGSSDVSTANQVWLEVENCVRAKTGMRHYSIDCPAAEVTGLAFSEAWELMEKGLGCRLVFDDHQSPLITLGKKDKTLYALDPVEKVWVVLAKPHEAMDKAGSVLIGAHDVVFSQLWGEKLPSSAFPQERPR